MSPETKYTSKIKLIKIYIFKVSGYRPRRPKGFRVD